MRPSSALLMQDLHSCLFLLSAVLLSIAVLIGALQYLGLGSGAVIYFETLNSSPQPKVAPTSRALLRPFRPVASAPVALFAS